MKIVIPMSGIGKRFLEAGYSLPKPLIEVDGKPIIEHVVNMFSPNDNFVFICNSNHIRNTNMKRILTSIAPNCSIIETEPHKKGPVYAVSKAFDYIDDDEEVIVNYCDFSCYWDYSDFLRHTRERKADGAIPAYKGFHPHMIGEKNYAFIKEKVQWMIEIKEKEPFTDNRMNEFASSGTYYFKRGQYIKKYFMQLMEKNIHINNEFYVSLVYNLLYLDGLRISIYEIQHMLQWGTPEDLEEYLGWSNYFCKCIGKRENTKPLTDSINLIPLAGAGNRFIKEGYKLPKPLLEIGGKPMLIQATNSLPSSEKYIFICLGEHLESSSLERCIRQNYSNADIIRIDSITKGQACTCEIGLKNVNKEVPLLIAACDNSMVWDVNKYTELMSDPSIDVIVWSFRHHVSSKNYPNMYGWLKVDKENNLEYASVKKPISNDPFNDHAIVGTFYFKKMEYFLSSLKRIYEKNITVNGEYYVDSCLNELISLGYKVKVFEVGKYICWGTPNDYKTFLYWQSFFHKCKWHPYDLYNDQSVDKNKIGEIEADFFKFKQEYQ